MIRSYLENHTRFQGKIGKVHTRFHSETEQKPYPFGHIFAWLISGSRRWGPVTFRARKAVSCFQCLHLRSNFNNFEWYRWNYQLTKQNWPVCELGTVVLFICVWCQNLPSYLKSYRGPFEKRASEPPGGGNSAYERGGDARRKFWVKTLKETDLGVAQAFFDP